MTASTALRRRSTAASSTSSRESRVTMRVNLIMKRKLECIAPVLMRESNIIFEKKELDAVVSLHQF